MRHFAFLLVAVFVLLSCSTAESAKGQIDPDDGKGEDSVVYAEFDNFEPLRKKGDIDDYLEDLYFAGIEYDHFIMSNNAFVDKEIAFALAARAWTIYLLLPIEEGKTLAFRMDDYRGNSLFVLRNKLNYKIEDADVNPILENARYLAYTGGIEPEVLWKNLGL